MSAPDEVTTKPVCAKVVIKECIAANAVCDEDMPKLVLKERIAISEDTAVPRTADESPAEEEQSTKVTFVPAAEIHRFTSTPNKLYSVTPPWRSRGRP